MGEFGFWLCATVLVTLWVCSDLIAAITRRIDPEVRPTPAEPEQPRLPPEEELLDAVALSLQRDAERAKGASHARYQVTCRALADFDDWRARYGLGGDR